MKIAIACGASGGHIFPGIATANALKDQGHDVTIILSGRNAESQKPEGWTGEIVTLPCPPLSRSSAVRAAKSALTLFSTTVACAGVLRQIKPDALLAMGAYTSVAPVLAARRKKIPVVLHEANVVPGKAIAFLSRFADTICVSFDDTTRFLKHRNIRKTGMPIRQSFVDAKPLDNVRHDRFTILVMGGSQGAKSLNHTIVDALTVLSKRPEVAKSVELIHLTGKNHEDEIRTLYKSLPIRAQIIGFSTEIQRLYASADFCISRAGAASIFELSHYGVPALLIPLPKSLANGHQTVNAETLQKLGACDTISNEDVTPQFLADYITSIRLDTKKLAAMRDAMNRNACPGAADALAQAVLDTAAQK